MKRDTFRSRLGFLLVSAGCAIGIGNVWKFPYVTGQNGGGVFVLFYLISLIIMGVPVLTMELAVGRASRKSAIQGYKALEPEKSKWHAHGWFCVLGNYLLMMYYTTVSGWMLAYCFRFLNGTFTDPAMLGTSEAATEAVSGVFGSLTADPWEMLLWTGLTILIGFIVCSRSLQHGLERISKVMMFGLLILIVVLAVHSFTLPGAAEGLKFYLLPDFEQAKEVGYGNIITAAMNQAFFTLSLGIGAMEIFGSYMSKEHTLASESVRICALDTVVAIFAGLIIFPACFSFNITPDQGPNLIFVTLPRVFINMAGGRVWGTLFFLFMTFASFTTIIAVFENLMAMSMDAFGWSRTKTAIINFFVVLIASVPCVLGFNVWGKFSILGMGVLDLEDFLVSNLLLPIGSIVFLLFCVTKWGWGFDKYLAEANEGQGIKLPRWLRGYFRWVLPVLVIIILVQGLIPLFTN